MTSGRSVMAMRSRIAGRLMTEVREAKSTRVALQVAPLTQTHGVPPFGGSALSRRLGGGCGLFSPPAPWPLSSTVMPASSYRTVKLLLDILQGMGVSTATGVRPLVPTLLVGALATNDLARDFDHTDFAFLESPWFLLAIAVALVVTTVLRSRFETPAGEAALGGIGMGLGALLFAGTLADHLLDVVAGHHRGLVCASSPSRGRARC